MVSLTLLIIPDMMLIEVLNKLLKQMELNKEVLKGIDEV